MYEILCSISDKFISYVDDALARHIDDYCCLCVVSAL